MTGPHRTNINDYVQYVWTANLKKFGSFLLASYPSTPSLLFNWIGPSSLVTVLRYIYTVKLIK